MTIMVIPNLRFFVGKAFAGLAQFREEEIREPQVVRSIRIAGSTSHVMPAAAFDHIAADGHFASTRPITLHFIGPMPHDRCIELMALEGFI